MMEIEKPKIEIRLFRVGQAGMFEIRTLDLGISTDIIYKISGGQPFGYAHRDAERLAVVLNCELYLDNKLIREIIK